VAAKDRWAGCDPWIEVTGKPHRGSGSVNLRDAFAGPILGNSIRIALVVGTILNLVNQYDRVVSGQGIAWWSFAFNYLVPYCVATVSATLHARHHRKDG